MSIDRCGSLHCGRGTSAGILTSVTAFSPSVTAIVPPWLFSSPTLFPAREWHSPLLRRHFGRGVSLNCPTSVSEGDRGTVSSDIHPFPRYSRFISCRRRKDEIGGILTDIGCSVTSDTWAITVREPTTPRRVVHAATRSCPSSDGSDSRSSEISDEREEVSPRNLRYRRGPRRGPRRGVRLKRPYRVSKEGQTRTGQGSFLVFLAFLAVVSRSPPSKRLYCSFSLILAPIRLPVVAISRRSVWLYSSPSSERRPRHGHRAGPAGFSDDGLARFGQFGVVFSILRTDVLL